MEDKFYPTIDQMKEVRKKIKKMKDKSGKRRSKLKLSIIGGFLRAGSFLSKGLLRMRSPKVVAGDDIDTIETGIKEGDPIGRLLARNKTHPDGFAYFSSTPSVVDASRIDALNVLGNMCEYYVNCIHCTKEFVFDAEKVQWDKTYDITGKIVKHHPETAYYVCPNCGCIINESERLKMLKAAMNRDEGCGYRPAKGHELFEYHVSISFNECTSTLSSMEKIARDVIDAGDDPDKMEVLYNQTFGKSYNKKMGESVPWEKLMDLTEPYIDKANPYVIPDEVLYIVMSWDIQRDRVENLTIGIGEDEEAWVLFYGAFEGKIAEKTLKDKMLEFYYTTQWIRTDGIKIKACRMFVDSGDQPTEVYELTAGRERTDGIWSIKGVGGFGRPLLPNKFSRVNKKRKPAKLINLGTIAGKSMVYNRLGLTLEKKRGPKTIHFPTAYCNSDFFKQLTAEDAIKKYTGLVEYTTYEKRNKHDPNEVFDLMYYAMAAMKHAHKNTKVLKLEIERIKELRKDTESNEVKINQARSITGGRRTDALRR